MVARFKHEFPDFPESEYPALPHDFVDSSWRNDSQPSMESRSLGLHVWIDRDAPGERELGGTRYGATELDNEGCVKDDEPILQTDHWSDVLHLIEQRIANGPIVTIELSRRDLATVLCALRNLQFSLQNLGGDYSLLPKGLLEIASDDGTLQVLPLDRFDDLCEHLSF